MRAIREPQTLEEAFRAFHRDNPHVYDELRRLALELVDRGHDRIGIGMLFEVLRWQEAMRTTGDCGFRLNNSHRALYARLLMDREPRLRGVFETRSLSHPGRLPIIPEHVFETTGQGALL